MKRVVGVAAACALSAGLVVSVAPGQAEAATVWDKVAKCESGGRWNINTGNGYYGGLQFSASTWRAYGGKKYASNAHKATKAEQITVAKRVLKGQGPGAWASCGKRAHLTRANGGAVSVTKAKTTTKKKAKPAKKKATAAKHSSTSAKTMRVRSGDTLSKIAQRYHVKGGWKALWKMNKAKVKNPNAIKVGQQLRVR